MFLKNRCVIRSSLEFERLIYFNGPWFSPENIGIDCNYFIRHKETIQDRMSLDYDLFYGQCNFFIQVKSK